MTRNLSESTQHTLPAILGISFFLALPDKKQLLFSIVLFLFATMFWTPFAAIGLAGFALAKVIPFIKSLNVLFQIAAFTLSASIAFLPVIHFLLGSEATSMASNKFIWNAGVSNWIFYYLIYLLSCFGIWLCIFRKWLFKFDSRALVSSLVILCALGLIQVGYFNDLNIRSSVPSQLVLGLAIGNVFLNHYKELSKKTLIAASVFLLINSISPFKFYYERFFLLQNNKTDSTIANPERNVYGGSFYDVLKNAYLRNGEEVVKQYSLRDGSIFEKHYLKK